MDKNSIDIKIREFATYLKDFGILNETNIKDFFATFKNITQKDFHKSNNCNNDINLELIYLKENLANAMLEFFNLMTEERKRMTYLNIYSKFLQKREKDLKDKGYIIYKLYCSLFNRKYFFHWKSLIPKNDIKDNNKRNNYTQVLDNYMNLKIDNFCFDIINDNNIKNNFTINSNNHKIFFDSNINSKSDIRSTINSISDINSLILSIKNSPFENNNNITLNQNNFKNKNNQYKKDLQKFNNNNIKINYKLNNIIFENYEQQNKEEKKEIKKKNQRNNKSQTIKYSNSNLINDEKNKTITANNDKNNKIKRKKNFIKLIEKDKTKDYENNIHTNRKTYDSNRPISNFNYDEYNRKNVYERLYEQKIKFIKRKEQIMEENKKEIIGRSNHPIIKSSSINKFNNIKKSYESKEKIKQNNIRKRNKINNLDCKIIDKNAVNNIENNIIIEKENKYSSSDNNYNKEKEENIKNNPKINGYKNKLVELFNEIIKNEEKNNGKKYKEQEKEMILIDLLNKIYQEKYQYQIPVNNSSEFSKTVEGI